MNNKAKVAVEVEIRQVANKGPQQWTATVGSITAAGATQAEAKASLASAIAAAVRGDYAPGRVTLADHEAVVWREPGGWVYAVRVASAVGEEAHYAGRAVGVDRADCLRAAVLDMAQQVDGALVRVGRQPIGETVLAEADREVHRDWVRWQRGYHAGQKAGLTEQQCRVVADLYRTGNPQVGDLQHYCHLEGTEPFVLPAGILGDPAPAREITSARFRQFGGMEGHSELGYRDGHTEDMPYAEFRARLLAAGPEGEKLHDQAVSHPWSWCRTARDPEAHAETVTAAARRDATRLLGQLQKDPGEPETDGPEWGG